MALLATTAGSNGADNGQPSVPASPASKRQNDDEHTPSLVLMPPDGGILVADHSSHASHSSHYSSSDGGGDYVPPTTPDTPAPSTPAYVAPAQVPAPPLTPAPPQAKQLDSVLLEKLAQVPSLWPSKVILLKEFGFTEIRDGVAVGVAGAPVGTMVDLIKVEGPKLVVSYLGNKAEIDASITDIGDRVDETALVSAPTTPHPDTNAPPAAPAPPPSTNSEPQTVPTPTAAGSTGTS